MRTTLLPPAFAVAFTLLLPYPALAQQDKPETPRLRLAVGGKSAIFYLPLSVTERLGYFKDAGLDIEIADVQSGARALQSLVGGSADVGVGTFDHTIQMQAKNQPVAAVVQYGRYPGFVLSMIASKAHRLSGPAEPEGVEDRRHVARFQHPFHGGLYAGAQRAQGRRRLLRRHRRHLDRGRRCEARRDRRHRQLGSDGQPHAKRGADQDRRRHPHARRHARRSMAGLIRAAWST